MSLGLVFWVGPIETGEYANQEHLMQLGVDACADVPAYITSYGTPRKDVPLIVVRGNSAIVCEPILPNAGPVGCEKCHSADPAAEASSSYA
jgi:hypothetical protein